MNSAGHCSASLLALAAAVEHGEADVLDPACFPKPLDTVARVAQGSAEHYRDIDSFLATLTDGYCREFGIDKQRLAADLHEARQRINGASTDEHMNEARLARVKDMLHRVTGGDDGDTAGWQIPSILDGIDLDSPPPTPDLLGIAYAGKTILISARPEAAKTWTAQVVGREALRRGGAVLVIDTDGTGQRDIAGRFISLGVTRESLADVAYSDDPRQLFNDTNAAALQTWIAERAKNGPVVVIIDSANPTLAALGFRLDEEGVTQLEAAAINPIKRAGGTVILIDHVAIHADRDSPYSIGTQRKHAAADVHLRLDSIGDPLTRNGPPAAYAIRGMKDRPGGLTRHGKALHMGRITFTPQPDGAVAADITLGPPTAHDTRATWRPTHLMERVSRWAELQPGAFSKRDVEREVSGKGPGLRTAVDVLYTEGHLKASGQRWIHHHPYRETDDPEAAE